MKAALGLLTAEDLVWLREREDEEGFGRMTCRPVRKRSREELTALYQSALDDRDKTIRGLWIPGDPKPIGKLTATEYNPRNRAVEVGYFLRREYRGKGYMTAALTGFCSLLFQERDCNKVVAQTGAFNDASIRLLGACGFHRDGILRQNHELDGRLFDDYLYSVLAEEYRNRDMEQGK